MFIIILSTISILVSWSTMLIMFMITHLQIRYRFESHHVTYKITYLISKFKLKLPGQLCHDSSFLKHYVDYVSNNSSIILIPVMKLSMQYIKLEGSQLV